MGLNIDVLGPVQVRDGSIRRVDVARPAHRRLLSILALAAGGRVSTDALIHRFWPSGPPETARAALQTHISGLRRALGDGVVATEGYGYRLNLDDHALDAIEFTELATDAGRHDANGESTHSLAAADAALALWRGEPYSELADDEFARGETVRLQELELELQELRAGSLIALGRSSEVLATLEALVVDHPFRERLWEHLMTARYRLGRHTDALHAFREVSQHLAEIGVEPGQPLRRLEERILLHDQFLSRTGEDLPDEFDVLLTRFPAAQWPITGRGSELAHVMERVKAGTGVAILGNAGVGKSRLLSEISNRAEANGRTVLRVLASEALKPIPFAPFLGLLPSSPTQDRLAMLREALQRLQTLAGTEGLVLAVDDAHHLDESSLAFMISVMSSGAAILCLTARTGEPMSADLVDLWTSGLVERIDLKPLGRKVSRQLIEAVLGGIDDDVEEELWNLAQGNPLVLHEAVAGGLSAGLVKGADEIWTLTGPLVESPRLTDLVLSRFDRIPEELRGAMDVVAVGSPLSYDLLDQATGALATDLEEHQLIAIAESVDGRTVTTPHPLYGELLRANLGADRARAATRRLVEAAIKIPDELDVLRVAVWQQQGGEVISPEVAVNGASAALVRHDPSLAEQLAGPVAEDDEKAGWILGRALSLQQRFDDAERILLQLSPADPLLNGEVASTRAHNLAFGLGRIDEARDLLQKAVDETLDPTLGARLRNERAMLSAMRGDFGDARVATTEVLSSQDADAVARASAYATLTIAQAMTGDSAELESIIDDAIAVAAEAKEALPLAEDQVLVMRMTAMIHAGQVSEAVDLGLDRASFAGRGNVMSTTWLSTLALAHDIAGRHAQAAETARRCLDLYKSADPFGLEAQTRGILAMALGQQGNAKADDSLAGVVLDIPVPRLAVWVDRGKAWASIARGLEAPAVEILVDSARNAIRSEHLAWAALCLHDVVRLGDARTALEVFGDLPSMPGAPLIASLRNHADALGRADSSELNDVAGGFAGFGAWLLAAECFAQASTLAGPNDFGRARYGFLSQACESMCEDPDTPALRLRRDSAGRREVEIALAACQGHASQAIAAQHSISARAVDNILDAVYSETGVGGSDELRTMLPVGLLA